MTVYVEDTPRNNLAVWAADCAAAGSIDGVVLSPFTSPIVGSTYKQSATRTVERLKEAGLVVRLDASTHALQMPAVGDFRYYDSWDLWGGSRGDLTTRATQGDHVARVIDAARSRDMLPIAPAALLTMASGPQTMLAVALAEEAIRVDPDAWITIAGTPEFWGSGADLDAFVAVLAQLSGTGFSLLVVRPTADLPPAPMAEEIAGLCRTARSLEQFGHVHVSHGDLGGLPAVAAGATSVGTGWDTRQMVCNYTSYAARNPAATGGGWLQRPTFQGLLGTMLRQKADQLQARDASLSSRLHPGPLHPDGPKETFMHHAAVLHNMVDGLTALDFKPAFRSLDASYEQAQIDWPIAASAAGTPSLASHWVDPLRDGLRSYAHDEGWI